MKELQLAKLRDGADIAGIDAQIHALEQESALLEQMSDEIRKAKPDASKSDKEKPVSVTAFEKAYAQKQHDINMGRIEEDEAYYSWLETAAKNAYDGLKDYEDDLYKYEEEVYNGRKQLSEDLYSKRIEDYKRFAEKAIEDNVDSEGNTLTIANSLTYSDSQINAAIAETQARIDGITSGNIAGNTDDIQGLKDTLDELRDMRTDSVKTTFENERELLEQSLEDGLITSSQYIDGYTALWENYYKDKKEFAKEDLQTQRDILEAQKSQIQEQIDALESSSELQVKPYEDEITAINEVQDKYNEMIDKRIEALEKEKAEYEKVNEEQEKANDLREKYLALQKASIKNRLVYTGNGNWEARRDEEEYNAAKKEYDEAKQVDVVSKFDEAIEALQAEKESRNKVFEDRIKALEETIKGIEEPFDNLITALSALIADRNNLDKEFVSDVLSSSSGKEALDKVNSTIGIRKDVEKATGIDISNTTPLTADSAISNVTAETANTDAVKDNTDSLNTLAKSVDSLASDIGTEMSKAANLTDVTAPVLVKQIGADKVDPVTKAEWEKRHKLSEYAPDGKTASDMTYEEYNKVKDKIVSLEDYVKSGGASTVLTQLASVINSGMKISAATTAAAVTGLAATAPAVMTNNNVGAPNFTCTINIDGSADAKTVEAMKNQLNTQLCEYTAKLTSAVNTAFTNQTYKR